MPAEAELPDTEEYGSEGSEEQEIVAEALNTNVAEKYDEKKLLEIGQRAKAEFEADVLSRKHWLDDTQDWLDLAMQVREKKSFPWPDASNIKYPLIATASLQFNARAYPTLIPGDGKLVKTRVLGVDQGGKKRARAERVAKFMSWQFMYDMVTWDEDMDRLFIMLPVCGLLFKKTFYCPVEDKIKSELVYPENFVVDYWTHTLEKAERYSEIMFMPERLLKERQANGTFLDVDLGPPPMPEKSDTANLAGDKAIPYEIIEQNRYEDLDNSGVAKPYIVTFHRHSAKVLRISPNFTPKDMKMDGKKVVAVKRHSEYYTKYGFIPNPDGSFYDLGFGHLLGPINEAVNTTINQLVDSGTLHNLQSGFIGRGLKLKMGDQAIAPGEWKAVNATGDDLRKQIVPLPTKEPSSVLFQLLGMLVQSGKELASVAEIFVGKMPGQNTPATTTMASIEQGMKVFTAIYKRVYRSMQKEFKKVYKLNGLYLDPQTYVAVLDESVGPGDFQSEDYDVCPTADPVATTQQEKLLKAQALMELLPSGMLDPMKVLIRVLEAQEQPDWQELIPQQPPQPKPDPKMLEMEKKAEIAERTGAQKMQMQQEKHAMDMQSSAAKLQQQAQSDAMKRQHEEQMLKLKTAGEIQNQRIFMAQSQNKLAVDQAVGQQKVMQAKQQGDQKLAQMKQQKSLKQPSSNGSNTRSQGKSKKR